MFLHEHPPAVCFVWQPCDLNAKALELDKTGAARIVVDLSICSLGDIKDSDHFIDAIDVKISLQQFFDASTVAFLHKRKIRTIWLEYFAEFLPDDFESFIKRLAVYPSLNIVTGDVLFITYFFQHSLNNCGLALKGSEASGFVGSETALSLLSLVEGLAAEYALQPPVHIWGGVATPEVTAGFLASGIHSVVFESLHWLTESFQQTYPVTTQKISRLRVDHSALIPISQKLFFRTFNKGNSSALKEICGKNKGENSVPGMNLSEVLVSRSIHALKSEFDGVQIVPIGIEAAFADSFQHRFGAELITATHLFNKEIERLVANSSDTLERFFSGEITREMGVDYPFLQGGMACITDIPAFSLSIAKAGGLPTIAFGMQDLSQIEEKYSGLSAQMQGYPYAINVIALSENPFRDAQLAWIKKNPPPFVVISAGDPSFASTLQEHNIQTIFVTSDVDLLQLAYNRGINYVVCEGCEAGGHVGELSLLTLAQAILDMKRKNPAREAAPKRLILAGGIFDHMSLFRAVLLGADAVQMGTAYLATTEIVASGALAKLYQKLVIDATAGDTTITGESVGLRVRSLVSPKIKRLQQLEKNSATLGVNDPSMRKNIEKESGGSLFIAARGLHPISRRPLSDAECLEEGQYMSGAVAGMLSKVVSIGDLHGQLAEMPPKPILQKPLHSLDALTPGPSPVPSPLAKRADEGIAVTGIAIANSLGNSPEEIWQACVEMKSGIGHVPKSRWEHNDFFSQSAQPGKTYCRVGAFLSLDISRKDLGISPHDFRTMTDSTKLTLWLAQKAIHDSDILSSRLPKERIGVIISQNSGEIGSTAEDLTLCVIADKIARSIQEHLDLDSQKRTEIENIIKAGRISIDDTTLLGRLNCTAGGFICNKYGFTGPSYAVSAACATGLVALYSAIQLIKNNVLDAAIIGGGEELLHPASYLEFSALGALAGKTFQNDDPTTTSRPFDRDRDGMVLGEGGAMIVIERKSSAIARKKKIYACISGIGASNNHKGMIESVAETQQLAIAASFRDAHYGPEQVDMVECHATATPTGDIEEVKALKAVYPKDNPVVLGSFKSQIGHTLGTSGLNSLIRGIFAMRAGVFPPTLNYNTVDARIDLESWGFKVCKQPETWPRPVDRPRRFQVNAFGFGGANYVVQLEEADRTTETPEPQPLRPLASTGADTCRSIGVGTFRTSIHGKDYRIASPHRMGQIEQIKNTLKGIITADGLPAAALKRLAKEGLFISTNAEDFPLALMFAGQGTHYSRMGLELYETFPTIRHWMGKIAELADFDILHMLFHEKETNLRKTVWQQPALFVLEYAIYQQLKEFDLQPVAMAGHSMGELTALTAAGCFSHEDAFRIISKRAACMEKASKIAPDPGTMIAVDVPEDILHELVATDTNLFYTNFNSPHQVVIGGGTREIERFKGKLDSLKYWSHILPVSMAFHSPLMRIIRDDLGDYLAGINFQPPRVPVISNTTRCPYPPEAATMREIILSHLESPVHWRNNVSTMWGDFAARLFVEIGPQDTLCKLLSDIEPTAMGLHTCYPGQEAASFRKTVAVLFAKGALGSAEPAEYIDLLEEATRQEERRQPKTTATIKEIIQREINLFALDGVERHLKPAIVKAIQQEVDASFKSRDLNVYFLPENSVSTSSTRTATSTTVSVHGTPEKAAKPVDAVLSRDEEIVEQVIAIIMAATGYERAELAAEMDIRQDLSIRSSRLPIIMDAAEQTFNIVIKLEEFMDVRTIGDFAKRVAEIIDSQGATPPDRVPAPPKDTIASGSLQKSVSVKSAHPIDRRVFRRREVALQPFTADMLAPGGHVLLLALEADSQALDLSRVLEKSYGFSVTCLKVSLEDEQPGTIDLGNAEKARERILDLAAANPLSGLIFLSACKNQGTPSLAQMSSLCTGFFAALQVFLKSNRRKFCAHITLEHGRHTVTDVLAEGILGLFLAAKIEYQSMLFRSFRNGLEAGAEECLRMLLNTSQQAIDLLYDDKKIFTHALVREPLPYRAQPALSIDHHDVVLVSGGARGITSILARALAAYGCKLVLLGRSQADAADAQNAQAGAEITATLQALRAIGVEAEYFCCDVTDALQTAAVVKQVRARYGRIDGIVHGAGILRDGFLQLLTLADFQRVLATKLSGIINLHEACAGNLRFIVGLSSIAAITGNVGQANYCCANRAMASYIRVLQKSHPEITAKTFWLPPVEGLGMAEDPDLKELIKIKIGDNAFLDVSEVTAIILKELLFGPIAENWVIPVRQLPLVPAVVMEEAAVSTGNDWFDCKSFPLLDRVLAADFVHGTLLTERVFRQTRDLWLHDHRPFTWLSQPILSAIIIVETFLESARLLLPSLQVKQVENVVFSRMFECPADQDTAAQILCRSEKDGSGQTVCHVILGKTLSLLQTEEQAGRSSYFNGRVVMTGVPEIPDTAKIDTRTLQKNAGSVMNKEDVSQYYQQRSGLTGRYRVLENISTYSERAITGEMIYPLTNDFNPPENGSYQYPAYMLEGLMQLVSFHAGIREQQKQRTMVPAAIDCLRVFQKCAAGDRLFLVGDLRDEESIGTTWEAKGYNLAGEMVMLVTGLHMHWLD